MNTVSEVLQASRKIVIKIGSNVISDDTGRVNKEILHNIVDQAHALIEDRRQVVIVSSGAGICGALVYFLIIPDYGRSLVSLYPEFADRYRPWLIFLWGTGIPCLAALALGWRIASGIGRDRSFTEENARFLISMNADCQMIRSAGSGWVTQMSITMIFIDI